MKMRGEIRALAAPNRLFRGTDGRKSHTKFAHPSTHRGMRWAMRVRLLPLPE
jgi:hypothetical protein